MFRWFFLLFFIFKSFFLFSQNNNELKSSSNLFKILNVNAPDSVIAVVNEAAKIWSTYIKSDIQIHLSVSYSKLNSNVYAYAKPTEFIKNVDGLPFKDVQYPVALAEKILGRNLNFDNPDVELVINNQYLWYTDFKTIPSVDTLDLLTFMIHEFAHGLGVIGNLSVLNSQAILYDVPSVFDNLITYSNLFPVVALFNDTTNASNDSILNVLTSNNLFYSGKYVNAFLSSLPKVYAPEIYNSGSSFYHFDEDSFPVGNINALLTPQLSRKDFFREPGIGLIALLADIGWNDYFLSHNPIPNISNIHELISFDLFSNSKFFNENSQKLIYSYDIGKNFTSLNFESTGNVDNWKVDLPPFNFEHTLNYGFLSVTTNGDSIYSPVNFPISSYQVFVGEDIVPPKISHNSIFEVSLDTDTLFVKANIFDNFEVDSAYIRYLVGNNDFSKLRTNGFINSNFSFNGSDFVASIPLLELDIFHGDIIAYNIIAVDKSGNSTFYKPEGSYSFINIEELKDPLDFYISDFENDSDTLDFSLDKFAIKNNVGFSNKALHTPHPYSSSYLDNTYIQYTATLKNPIILSNSPSVMQFDEIVLVEPGRPNIPFGSFGFWDYVVVEGAKDRFSDTWYPLGKVGYDSQFYDDWLKTYYSSIIPDNNNSSVAVANEKMYKTHVINLLENKYFRTNDTIFVRFRLQSDFSTHAWGWVIDNVKIQENQQVSVDTICNYKKVFPVPCKDILFLNDLDDFVSYKIIDVLGRIIQENVISNSEINVSLLNRGVYQIIFIKTNSSIEIETFVKD